MSEKLIEANQSPLLLKLFDQEYESIDAYLKEQQGTAINSAPALVSAFLSQNRKAEGTELGLRVLRRLTEEIAGGVDPGSSAYQRAQLFALLGRSDLAVKQLSIALDREWGVLISRPYSPLASRFSFKSTRQDPRLVQIQAAVDERVNVERAKLGLPPI